jgi:orc1/cdc6 family replication initiation protein
VRSSNRIIEDARVLTADYLPNRMVHRDGEREAVARNLEPVLEGEPPINMMLYGPPGTGKTATARYVTRELEKHSPDLLTAEIDCFRQPSRFELYYRLVTETGEFVTRDGTSTGELVDSFERKAREKPIVVLVDEADQIRDEKILFDLSRFQRVGIVMTANRREAFADADSRIRSSFSTLDEVKFSPYTAEELTDILLDRRKFGLKPESVSREQLERIAERSNGDARVAIGALRIAAQKAENQDLEEIPEEVVEDSFSDAVEENRSMSLEKLNRHQRVLYDQLKESGELGSGELFDRYRDEVEDPRTDRTLRRYMKKMESYGLVEVKGAKRGRKYALAE